MVETERAPLKAEGAKGALLVPDSKVCFWGGGSRRSSGWRKWIYGSAWAVLAESDHPVTGGAVFCVIFLPGRREYSTLRMGQRSQFGGGLNDGDIFHVVQIRSSKFLDGRGLSASSRPTAPERPSTSLPLTLRSTLVSYR